ncbi:DUF4931 domain-containing protein [bacterium]|nr:DUF4931 domain-containing protein [bacterium]
MPEMRHDPVQRRWVVISPERGLRPTDYKPCREEKEEYDPFAEGNESDTPPEITAVRPASSKKNGPGWTVRVVPNKYPAFRVEGDLDRRADGLYDAMNGVGAHETVIEATDRDTDIALVTPEHAFQIGRVYRERLVDLMKDKRLRYVLIFRNRGRLAGASLSHPHSQIVATSVTPLAVAIELDSARRHYDDKERCLFCDLLAQEKQARSRIVYESDRFVAYTPYASRVPFEICLMPKQHQHDFREISDNDLRAFMTALQNVLQRIKVALDDPPYNFFLHSSPNSESLTPRSSHWTTLRHDWHWHLEILPRLGNMAGFEFGTGFFINSTPPEQAAEILRAVSL